MVFYILNVDFSAKKARKIERYRGLAILWGMAKCLEKPLGVGVSKQAKHTTGHRPLKEKDGMKK